MTDFLVRVFIRDRENVQDARVRTAYGVLASIVGICCNLLLFLLKLAGGLLMGSISVMADAFNNLSDAASSIVSFIGVKLAGRPADEEHPFGHGRYEYIAALVVALLVLEVGFSCLKSSVGKVFHPEMVRFEWLIVLMLVFSVLVKVWMAFFNRKLGKKIHSKVMQAAAADSFGDVLVTSATVLSLLAGKWTGLAIDGYMGIIVSAAVLVAGFNIAKDTLEPLLGEAIDREVYDEITSKVESYEGILGSHDLIVHNYGPTHSMATIHAEVSNESDIETAHELVDRIEREVLRDLNIFLVIHMDPVEVRDESVAEHKRMVADIVQGLEPDASIHDFRVVNGKAKMNLIFDLVVPYSYDTEKEMELVHQIMELVRAKDERCECVMHLENSFVQQKERGK
ncbi:MAG: cation diffusion facilitator family transporter [Lachnospiraceae bacterium]|nr:cation diffusion facilitator family transporter [Lachnospiraceae bacterium]